MHAKDESVTNNVKALVEDILHVSTLEEQSEEVRVEVERFCEGLRRKYEPFDKRTYFEKAQREVGKVLKKYRKMYGYTQEEMASKLLLQNHGMISRYESGKALVQMDSLLLYSFVFNEPQFLQEIMSAIEKVNNMRDDIS